LLDEEVPFMLFTNASILLGLNIFRYRRNTNS